MKKISILARLARAIDLGITTVIYSIIAMTVAVVLYQIFFNARVGYCMTEARNLSDQELIEIALRHKFNTRNTDGDGANPSLSQYLADHRDCCRVIHAAEKTLYEKIFQTGIQTIDTDFSVEFIHMEQYVNIDACGNVIRMHGITYSRNSHTTNVTFCAIAIKSSAHNLIPL
ncbi:MAG TPA: hypothetical protein VIF82_05025 [Burkholderiaceae bacterium]|jgi:hypothetical protein